MAKIVKLASLLPEDIAFEMPGGQRFVAPGDPPLDLILKIASLFERAEDTEGEDADGFGLDVLRELDAEVVRLLQMRDPDLVSSPFGVMGVQHFVATLLGQYGFGEEGEGEGDKPEDPPKRASRSKRSSGSRSS